MAKVAFLGLGVMGYPMARHLKDKGHEVTVYNRTGAKADKWVSEHGGTRRQDAAEAAEGQEIVFACVGNDDDLRQVTLGPDGAFEGMGAGLDLRRPHHGLGGSGARALRRRRRRRASPSSTRRSRAVRRARRTACSR